VRTKRVRPKWIRFTEETNALDYLERAGEFIAQAEEDPRAWKWVVLALHGALYGFSIAACKGTDYQTVVRKTKKGTEHLVSLDEALTMCADPDWMGTLHGGLALDLTASQKDSIRELKKTFRNNFEHYVPRGWSIEIHGFPQIAMDVLDVISFLAIETFRYQHLNQSQRRKVKSIVYQAKKRMGKSRLHAEALAAVAKGSRPH
jgi:hypothetical protein